MSFCTVFFMPFWEFNPYHVRLRRDLAQFDVRLSHGEVLPTLEEAPEIIHLHGFRSPLRIHNARLARARAQHFLNHLDDLLECGSALVVTLHDVSSILGFNMELDADFTRSVLERAHRVIYHSPYALARADSLYGLSLGERAREIPHPHYINAYKDTLKRRQARRSLDLPLDCRLLLAFGALRENKGLQDLVSAYSAWQPELATGLVIVGSPVHNTPIETLEAAAQADSRIVLRPESVPDDQVATYLRAANCAVLPYREITTSGSLVLAMSFGLPVIAPNAWYFADVLDEEGAILYDPEQPGGLAQALEQFEQDQGRLPDMGRANLRKARDWSPPLVAERTWEVYLEAMASVPD